ncbi:MAG: lipid-A-disaccharide synthase, partial [Bacteroidetes bacterium]|nr:lipid-A-disaccharide synthase [Bacteroidota bacterium]
YNKLFDGKNVNVVFEKTYQLLLNSSAALVTSGTATLETALFEIPEVVCYKGSFISFMLAKRLVKIKYISLVNLIMNKEVVKELIQSDFNINSLTIELSKILNNKKREEIITEYRELKKMLGGSGASTKTAEFIFKDLCIK